MNYFGAISSSYVSSCVCGHGGALSTIMASCKLMQVFTSLQERRSWRIVLPKFNIKLFMVLVFLAYLLIFKILLLHRSLEHTSDPATHFNFLENYIRFKFKYYNSYGSNRRLLLQAGGRSRPTPIGYPPPGDNQQIIPRAPSSEYSRPSVP